MVATGEATGFGFLVHSHMLRHSCGYKLANDGQDTRAIQHYLGHRSLASTVRYTALAPDRFRGVLEGLKSAPAGFPESTPAEAKEYRPGRHAGYIWLQGR
jgi:hypothetical protein